MRRALLGVALTFAFAGCSGTAVAPDTAGGSAGTNAGDGSIGGSSGASSNGGSTASNAGTGSSGSTSTGSSGTTAATQGTSGSGGTTATTATTATTQGTSGSNGTTATTQGTSGSTATTATTQGTNGSTATASGNTGSTGTTATTVGTSGSTGTTATTVGTSGSTGTSATTAGTTTGSTAGTTTGSSAGTTSGSTGSSGSTGGTPQGFVRAADFVPFGLNADFCYKPAAASTYTGPVMANAGVSAGIGFGEVTRYFGFDDPAPSGGTTYTIAVVLAGSGTCANPQAQANLTVTANTYSTIYGVGVPFGTPALSQQTLSDDSAPLSGNSTAFRFVNAGIGSSAAAVDLGALTSNTFGSIFNNVLYTDLSSTSNFNGSFGTVDANGYLGFDARNLQLRVRTHGTTGNSGVLDSQTVNFAATTRHSLFLIGNGGTFPYQLLDCTDELTVATAADAFTSCQ